MKYTDNPADDNMKWTVEDTEYLFRRPWLTVRRDTVRLPDGTVTSDFPYCVGHNAEGKADVEPIYDELPGWLTDISAARRESELPQAFRDYIAYIEKHVGVPVSIISVGPDREETIVRS